MGTWDREELYAEVWEKPLVKVAPKYGISAVALAKVCRKLQIPLPGRGYWTKKECSKPRPSRTQNSNGSDPEFAWNHASILTCGFASAAKCSS
jgi:hypothetical protein